MARQTIDIGSTANDGTGDPLRTAFNKVNENFIEVYDGINVFDQNLNTSNNVTFNEITASSNVTADSIQLDISAGVSVEPGELAWNNSDGTLDIGIGYGDVVLQVGQETHYVVRNATGVQIENGTALYCTGVTVGSGRLEVSPMIGDGSVDPVQFIGLATMDINNGVNGVATWFGYVRGLDTRGTANTAISVGDEDWSVGDKLYVHPTAPGKLTSVEPEAPNTKICVAVVINRNQTAGVLFVRPTTNLVLSKLSDVEIDTPQDGQVLQYVSANTRWESSSNVTFNEVSVNGGVLGQVYGDGIGVELTLKSPPGVGDSGYVALASANEKSYVEVNNIGIDLAVEYGTVNFKKWEFDNSGNLTAPGTISAANVNATTSFGLPVYATDAARDTAIPSPQPGMMVFVTGGEGAGLQVRGATQWNPVGGLTGV
jgi:hypothetical protein